MTNFLDNYETVEERLAKFIADYPDFRVETQLVSAEGNRFIVQAWIYRTYADSVPFSSGLAFEDIAERGVNATSALENAETSSLGRCLANAGYAAKGKRASKTEMAKVINHPSTYKKPEPVAVENPADPWTVVEKPAPEQAKSAVELVQETLGGVIMHKEIPHCEHGEMAWKTGISGRTKKPWGSFVCAAKAYGCEPKWYQIGTDGSWQPQKGR